ncbi:MAG: 6-bladed beta-propeller [Candidatus Krumholzibacteria bacterium]|nr:6-bladed beta-propeller [Candidatus Krumholzibacteria bacterium]
MKRGLGGALARGALVAVLVAALSFAGAVVATAGDWQGKVVTADGKRTVTNPALGFKEASTVAMEELWRLGGDSEDEEEFFGVIADIDIDADGLVYLLDSQIAEVKIYTKDGEFVRSIGRQGEGPGEFRFPNALFFTDDGNVAVVQTIPGKIVILSKEGDPLGDHPLPEPEDGGFQMLQGASAAGGNTVLFMNRDKYGQAEGWARSSFLVSVDATGNELARYADKTHGIDFAAPVMEDAPFDTFERRWTVAPDGKVYACTSYENYEVHVWNADGSLDRVITREYKHRARTAKEKDFMAKMMGFWAQRIPNCEVKIHDQCKDIESVYVRDDGSIWVLGSNGARDLPEGTLGVFDLYNKDGQFVRNVTLKGQGDPLEDNYVFVKDRFYVVTSFLQAAMSAQGVQDLYDEEDDAEPMAVICYKLEGDLLAAR